MSVENTGTMIVCMFFVLFFSLLLGFLFYILQDGISASFEMLDITTSYIFII